ncbi:MAG TPA: HAMP domain-containing sensor histidine kinase [Candidatus Acidoferrales bacterium]|nr:HAMP domain-containing sensor histidine kinase [Candidatus Acidoferrales bacterium]
MKRTLSLRVRMMLLFCVTVGVLLAGSYVVFYLALQTVIHTEFDHRLIEAEAPVAADIATDPNDADIVAMDIPGEYFETVDLSGRVRALSKNLNGHAIAWTGSTKQLQTARDPVLGRLRLGIAPIHRPTGDSILILAIPMHDIYEILTRFRALLFILFPCTLLILGGVSAWYVGRSLKPIAALTQETSRMADRVRVGPPGKMPERATPNELPIASANRDDELGRLADAFNKLFVCMEGALLQLRQFVSDASHELRTPLSILQGETELLLKEPRKPEEYHRALEIIDSELKKLSRIVEGLFTLAMADAGQLRLAHDPVYLNEVLEEACALVAPRARAKGIAIERQLSAEVPYTGDEAFLRQLFLVFLDNALKYSRAESRIHVQLAAENGTVQVQFQDQGVGIAADHLPHIFERFYRGLQPDSAEAQSGGLGLAIAQAIVRAQGGTIECASEPGSGSTFTISFPRQTENGQSKN